MTLSAPTRASSIETSRWAPCPVRVRRQSAAMIAPIAWAAARTSAACRFEARGAASSPCSSAIMPEAALMMWAKAGRSRHGPVWPKPEIEQ